MEVEAKFAAVDAETLQHLAEAAELAGYELEAGVRRHDRDTFLDTPTRRFLAAGYYLRRRETDDGVRLTLKELVSDSGGVLRREELEALVAADVPAAEWPAGELRERVERLCAGAPLEPLLSLAQERLARRVRDGAREVAELSLDHVTVSAGGAARDWHEAEVELRGEGRDDDLVKLIAALRELGGLVPEPRSKFARALEMVEAAAEPAAAAGGGGSLLPPAERPVHEGFAAASNARGRRARALLALDDGLTQAVAGARAGMSDRRVRYWLSRYRDEGVAIYGGAAAAVPGGAAARGAGDGAVPDAGPAPAVKKRPGIDPADSMTEAARKTLRFHLERMLEHEEGTRLGEDPEELHDMRVATRRMRMALRVFRDYLDPGTMRPVLKGLRRTGRTLGAVRDLDVFFLKTRAYLGALPPERSGDLDGLLAAWRAERERQRERLVTYLDGRRYRGFVEVASELLDGPAERLAPRASAGLRPQRVAQVLPGVLYKDMAQVWAFEGQLGGVETPLPRFHALRIACKGLRYTLEFFEGVLGPDARPMIKKVKHMQDHLGDLQDAVVTSGILRDYLTWGTWRHGKRDLPGPTEIIVAPGEARYLVARQEEMERLILTFSEVWTTIAGTEFSRGLAAVIAEI